MQIYQQWQVSKGDNISGNILYIIPKRLIRDEIILGFISTMQRFRVRVSHSLLLYEILTLFN